MGIKLVSKPLMENAVKISVLEDFGIPFSRTFQKRMQVWLRDNPRSKFGSHLCNASELGMDPDLENERFSFYLNRFNWKKY